jgi:glycerol-3-phosphate acyltransferase PlsX
MRIGVDAMGGDFAPGVVIEGLAQALVDFPTLDIVLVGHKERVEFYLEKYGLTGHKHIELIHAPTVCEMSESSAVSLRSKRDSSITALARMLKSKEIDAMATPGHTGATVAATKVLVRTLPGIDRPALGASMPCRDGRFMLMDAGANPDCTALNLEQFAIMGEIYAQYLFKKDRPTVGLLSVGGEDIKGCDLTKEAFKRLERLPINFIGNVEADTVFEGGTDVLVSDGFAGNVLLKCAEGLAKSTFVWLKRVLKKNTLRYVWAMMAQNVFRELKAFGDADNVGGAPLLGINGICIIGHGSSNPKAVLNAIRVAAECVNFRLNEKIVAGIKAANEANAKLAAEQTGN